MKKALKSIARSMKTLILFQKAHNIRWDETLAIQMQNLRVNEENLSHHSDTARLMMKRFELEHTPFISVLEGLLELVAVERITDVQSQEVVDEAKRMIRLMKSAQEKS